MESLLLPLNLGCKPGRTWRMPNLHYYYITKSRLLFAKPSKTQAPFPSSLLCFSRTPSASVRLRKKFQHHPPQQRNLNRHKNPSTERNLHFKTFNQSQVLKKGLIEKLRDEGFHPIQLLEENGDWSKEEFWSAIKLLRESSRAREILQLFYAWKNLEKSRINEFNFKKIVGILVEEGVMEDALSVFGEMESHGLRPSLEIYNSIVHGFATKGKFEDALFYLNEIKQIGLCPDSETYDGLIETYGKHRMFDEMDQCVKKMEADGCSPDHVTYNLLIREFSRARLLRKMESTYQILISNRMDLQPSTLVAMLEAYVELGLLDKMEKVCRRVLNSKMSLKEDLIRKVAAVYIENHMFSRLGDLGLDLSLKTGTTDLVWCLRILSHACLLSRKGIDAVLQEMESEGVPWSVTVANIILLAYLKMKDFKRIHIVLSELPARHVKPDIITVGVLLDAGALGFNGFSVKNTWKRLGIFDEDVEMKTDVLLLVAFGKGQFLRRWEETYSSLDPKARKEHVWTYRHIINLSFSLNSARPQLMGIVHKGTKLDCG